MLARSVKSCAAYRQAMTTALLRMAWDAPKLKAQQRAKAMDATA
jgi:hypothetical protein